MIAPPSFSTLAPLLLDRSDRLIMSQLLGPAATPVTSLSELKLSMVTCIVAAPAMPRPTLLKLATVFRRETALCGASACRQFHARKVEDLAILDITLNQARDVDTVSAQAWSPRR